MDVNHSVLLILLGSVIKGTIVSILLEVYYEAFI